MSELTKTTLTKTKDDGDLDAFTEALMALSIPRTPKKTKPPPPPAKVVHVLTTKDLAGVAAYIIEAQVKKIIVMTGAGISVSAGIPDFRTPGTGLYSNLAQYRLPTPEAIFDLSYFRKYPQAFYQLAQELFPDGQYQPTHTHHFIALLAQRDLLLRNYTQNIDGLEARAGIPDHLVIQAHGGFHSASCIDCRTTYTPQWVQRQLRDEVVPRCSRKTTQAGKSSLVRNPSHGDDPPSLSSSSRRHFHEPPPLCGGDVGGCCGGLVKPDITFFGEQLPARFHRHIKRDFQEADLLLVLGTSLQVQPFASLIDTVRVRVPRLLINREAVVQTMALAAIGGGGGGCGTQKRAGGFRFEWPSNKRDVFHAANCDDGVHALVQELGDEWSKAFDHILVLYAIEEAAKREGLPKEIEAIIDAFLY